MTGNDPNGEGLPPPERAGTSVREVHAHETAVTYRPMVELRQGQPQLLTPEAFVAWVNERQRPEGYRLVASFEAETAEAVAVAGFRRIHSLAFGDALYVDDLVTLPEARGRGHADALFTWLFAEARRLGCVQFHLDSGARRHTAHRFYLNHGLAISAFHFQCTLAPEREAML